MEYSTLCRHMASLVGSRRLSCTSGAGSRTPHTLAGPTTYLLEAALDDDLAAPPLALPQVCRRSGHIPDPDGCRTDEAVGLEVDRPAPAAGECLSCDRCSCKSAACMAASAWRRSSLPSYRVRCKSDTCLQWCTWMGDQAPVAIERDAGWITVVRQALPAARPQAQQPRGVLPPAEHSCARCVRPMLRPVTLQRKVRMHEPCMHS